MTFKDLKKRVTLESAQQQAKPLERLLNKPFWIWNVKEHKHEDLRTNGDCCFNHIIGLPQKNDHDKPLYDYQQIIIDSINPDNFNPYYFGSRSMGIDPAYGSSAFGIVVTEWQDDHIRILYAEEHHRPDYNEMLSLVYSLMSKYQVDKTYIDGANPSFIRSLKLQIGEDAEHDKVIARYKAEGFDDMAALANMKVVPVNFNKEHKTMLGHCKMILEQEPGKIAINPERFDKLITSLRTAVDNDGTLDKESTSYNDIFDAFRLALKFYHFREMA